MEEKSPINLAKQVLQAGGNWIIKDGLNMVSDEVLLHRKSICSTCPHWNPKGFVGMGKCVICGCSAGKLYLPSSNCPLPQPKWTSVPPK